MYLASCGSVPDVPPPISRFDYAGAAFPAQLPAFQPRLFHEEDVQGSVAVNGLTIQTRVGGLEDHLDFDFLKV